MLFWVQTTVGHSDPDNHRVVGRGDLTLASGRVIQSDCTLDAVAEEYLGETITLISKGST